MRYYLSFIFCILLLNASSQTPEDIGQSIFESFKNGNDSCFKYFMNEDAVKDFQEEKIKLFKEGIDSGATTWEIVGRMYGIEEKVVDESSLIKGLRITLEKQALGRWAKNLSISKGCDAYKLTTQSHRIIKLEEEGQLYRFQLIVDAQKPFALTFFLYKLKDSFFLAKISKGLHFKDSKGKFTCVITCTEGKEASRQCE